jgi:hypothetical protein
MSEPSRGSRISRRSWLLAGLAAPLFRARAADSLAVTFDGDSLHIASPDVHFLIGKPLQRLTDGGTVVFLGRLTLFRDPFVTPFRRSDARFVVSYDIWSEKEPKFSVKVLEPVPRTALLSAPAAEAWCIDSLAVNASGLAPDRPFWLLLDLRTVPHKDLSQVLGDSGISIKNFFIEFFSRQPGTDDPQWTRPAGPLRLADLVRTHGRGKIE